MTQISPLLVLQASKAAQEGADTNGVLSIDTDPSAFSVIFETTQQVVVPTFTLEDPTSIDAAVAEIDTVEEADVISALDLDNPPLVDPELAAESAAKERKGAQSNPQFDSLEQTLTAAKGVDATVITERQPKEVPPLAKATQIFPELARARDGSAPNRTPTITVPGEAPKATEGLLFKKSAEISNTNASNTSASSLSVSNGTRIESPELSAKTPDSSAEPPIAKKQIQTASEVAQKPQAQPSNAIQAQIQFKAPDEARSEPGEKNATERSQLTAQPQKNDILQRSEPTLQPTSPAPERKGGPSPAEIIITSPQNQRQEQINRQTSGEIPKRPEPISQSATPTASPAAPTTQTPALAFAATPLDGYERTITSDMRIERLMSDAFGIGPERSGAQPLQTPVATAPIPTADQARQIALQLAQAMPTTAPGTTEITLNPEELGRVRMSLSITEGAMTLTIAAERPETTDIMRRHIDQLAQSYRQLGFADMTFNFAESSQGGHPQGTSEREMNAADTAQQDQTGADVMQPSLHPDGRMDVRL